MAVPKKKMSKSKRDSRKSNWKKKLQKKVKYALSLSKSKNSNFNYLENPKSQDNMKN